MVEEVVLEDPRSSRGGTRGVAFFFGSLVLLMGARWRNSGEWMCFDVGSLYAVNDEYTDTPQALPVTLAITVSVQMKDHIAGHRCYERCMEAASAS